MTLSKTLQGSLALLVFGGQIALADRLQVEFPKSPRFPVFGAGEKVEMTVSAQRDNPDTEEDISWMVTDWV